jgi:hypothetical protein
MNVSSNTSISHLPYLSMTIVHPSAIVWLEPDGPIWSARRREEVTANALDLLPIGSDDVVVRCPR